MANALPVRSPDEILYPSSDGLPVAETDVHIDELLTLRTLLRIRYGDRDDVYVAGNLLVYYEEGNPAARVAPDAFVVFGVPAHNRRVFKVWEEQACPSFVMELTSRGTWLEDVGNKKALYARLGVEEYFMFDPEADYLVPPLQAQRLLEGEYRPLEPRADGGIESRVLGVVFHRDGQRLKVVDAATGATLLRPLETHSALVEAERAKVEAERAKAEAERAKVDAEQRTRDAEAETARLREELAALRR